MDEALSRLRRIETWARAGYAVRGLVYLLLGGLVIGTGRGVSASAAVETVRLLPAGAMLLVVIGLGLFGYGLFRLYEALVDLEGRGDGVGGRLGRAGRALGGLAYWALAAAAARTLLFGSSHGGDERAAHHAAREVAQAPGGSAWLVVAGLVVLGIAVAQARRAWSCDFWPLVRPDAPRVVRHLGRLGYFARAVIILLVGWFLVRAGFGGQRVRGLGGALDSLHSHPLLLNLVGAGLLLFGLFSLAMARYRRIPDDDLIARFAPSPS